MVHDVNLMMVVVVAVHDVKHQQPNKFLIFVMHSLCILGMSKPKKNTKRLQHPTSPRMPGYMGVPYYNTDMTSHPQYISVRNKRGAAMLEAVAGCLEEHPTMSHGDRTPFVMSTLVQDDECVSMRVEHLICCFCTVCVW